MGSESDSPLRKFDFTEDLYNVKFGFIGIINLRNLKQNDRRYNKSYWPFERFGVGRGDRSGLDFEFQKRKFINIYFRKLK